jgi:hypothetical protein
MSKKNRGAKKHDRAKRVHAEKIRSGQKRAERVDSFAKLIHVLTNGEVGADKILAQCSYSIRRPSLGVVADQRVLDFPGHELVLDDLRCAVAEATVELLPHGITIPLSQFFSHHEAIAEVAAADMPFPKKTRDAQVILAKHVLPHASENHSRAMLKLLKCVFCALLPHWRIDRAFCVADLAFEGGGLVVSLSVSEPKSTSFDRDGERRPAWRCGFPAVTKDLVAPTRGMAAVQGAPDGSPPSEVFLQSHALKRLRERVPVALVDTGVLEAWASYSLMRPVVSPQGPKNWLVEFRIKDARLGYFTAVEIDGRTLVTSFLFLTMRDTPEGKLIRERLGLRADEIEWLRADSLPFFTQSDVAQDSDLRAILTECGCGHLFDLIEPEAREITFRGAARDLRRHLGMPIPPLMQGLFAR